MKKTFAKVLVTFMVTVAFMNFAGCNNNADSDIDESYLISTLEEFNVLGIYKSDNEIFEFYADGSGMYHNGNLGHINDALKDGPFKWTVSGTTITMKQGDNGETATWSNSGITRSNGRNIGFREPSAEDLQGKTAALLFPTTSKADKKLIPNWWYPTKIQFGITKVGDEYEGRATIRARNANGIRTYENELGYWKINGNLIILRGRGSVPTWSYGVAQLKHCRQTNRIIAIAPSPTTSDFLYYQVW